MKINQNNKYIKRWVFIGFLVLCIVYIATLLFNKNIIANRRNLTGGDNLSNSGANTIIPPVNTGINSFLNSNPINTPLNVNEPTKEIPENLLLVNHDYSVNADYCPEGLINIFETYGTSDVGLRDRFVLMNEDAYLACREMFIAAEADGINGAYILSGYRDYRKQSELYSDYVAEGGLSDKYPYVSKPGQSEHHTGLAIDIAILSQYVQATNDFEKTEQGSWFIENCWDYGFILRFAENKKDITGVAYESWHFRYVGKEHSLIMKISDLCLEEYLELYFQLPS